MNVFLLYEDRDWKNPKSYYDWNCIVKDLGLETLFELSKSDYVMKNGRVMYFDKDDEYLALVLRKVMQVPLTTKSEINYRQQLVKECLQYEGFVNELYQLTSDILHKWDKLGRKNKTGMRDSKAVLISDMKICRLMLTGIDEIRKLLIANYDRFSSKGLLELCKRLDEEFSKDKQKEMEDILSDISFYLNTDVSQVGRNAFKSYKPRIVLECGLDEGFKFSHLRLSELETEEKIFSTPNGMVSKIVGQINNINPNCLGTYSDPSLQDDVSELEFQVVSYVMNYCNEVAFELGQFIDELHFQIAFYRAAINLKHKTIREHIYYCFPTVNENNALEYKNLKDYMMHFEQKKDIVGNTGVVNKKNLVVITGANQGGKSTFLRSLGIAQVMFQCGLFVAADEFSNKIYPNFFTHFTRREDVAMNSGRLDEELKRMNNIIDKLGDNSLILLNESFATTTEKEGSAIAYDIIKALKKSGVTVITVTHLLSFAQRVYDEENVREDSDTLFLSAERLPDGQRTYKIIAHKPELTSFGLDLYDSIISKW